MFGSPLLCFTQRPRARSVPASALDYGPRPRAAALGHTPCASPQPCVRRYTAAMFFHLHLFTQRALAHACCAGFLSALCVASTHAQMGHMAQTTSTAPNASPASPKKTSTRSNQTARGARAKATPQAKKTRSTHAASGRSARPSTSYAERSDARDWIASQEWPSHIPTAWLHAQLAKAVRLPGMAPLVLPPAQASAKNWATYRSRFVEPKRIAAGLAFWRRHQDALARAQATYGVPMHIIVGIIGVETLYGQQTGHVRVLDALATLAFDFPAAHPRAAQRQEFFASELGHFLQLAHASGQDPAHYRGSYAGAMGLPQFMPSSWRRLAVDFDGDGQIDLYGSPVDAIGSVAHYLQKFSWQSGMPTHFSVALEANDQALTELLQPDIVPTFSPQAFERLGAKLDAQGQQHTGRLALIELRNGHQSPSHVAGTDNFYALTRYNWSSYYAMAVIELAQAVADRMDGGLQQAAAAAVVGR